MKQLGVDDNEVNGFDVDGSMEYAKKSEKTSKSQNSTKPRKKLSKSENSTNFDAIKAGSKFLTPDARTAFNCLRLAFIEVLILGHFNLKYHIWIETNVLGYTISEM